MRAARKRPRIVRRHHRPSGADAPRRRHRGREGPGRLPPCLRRTQRGGRTTAARAQAPPHQAARRDVCRPQRPAPGVRGERRRARPAHKPPHPHRAAAPQGCGERAGESGDCAERGGRPARAGRHASLHAPAAPAAARRGGASGDDERQPRRRAHHLRRPGGRVAPHRRGRRLAGQQPPHLGSLRRLGRARGGRPHAGRAPRPRHRPHAREAPQPARHRPERREPALRACLRPRTEGDLLPHAWRGGLRQPAPGRFGERRLI